MRNETGSSICESDARIARHPLCVTCGYDLFGLVKGSACPECGAPWAASFEFPAAPARVEFKIPHASKLLTLLHNWLQCQFCVGLFTTFPFFPIVIGVLGVLQVARFVLGVALALVLVMGWLTADREPRPSWIVAAVLLAIDSLLAIVQYLPVTISLDLLDFADIVVWIGIALALKTILPHVAASLGAEREIRSIGVLAWIAVSALMGLALVQLLPTAPRGLVGMDLWSLLWGLLLAWASFGRLLLPLVIGIVLIRACGVIKRLRHRLRESGSLDR